MSLYTDSGPGALAQLGERRLCKAEVAGSIPARSIGGLTVTLTKSREFSEVAADIGLSAARTSKEASCGEAFGAFSARNDESRPG